MNSRALTRLGWALIGVGFIAFVVNGEYFGAYSVPLPPPGTSPWQSLALYIVTISTMMSGLVVHFLDFWRRSAERRH